MVPALLAVSQVLSGCGAAGSVHDFFLGGPSGGSANQAALSGFIGGVAADEPRAVLVARQVLAQGGNAADAAVALGMTLAVTLPSRASLGSGGACLAYQPQVDGPGKGIPQAILFTPRPPASPGAQADRPAAVPMLARGLFLLHALYGRRSFEALVSPAEELARFGTPVSRAFAADLAVVGAPLLADPPARAVFARPGTAEPLAEGDQLLQPDLGATLAQLRVAGVGDLYQGALANRLAAGSASDGAGLQPSDLRGALPQATAALVVPAGRDEAAFLPAPTDDAAAATAFRVLERGGDLQAAGQRALAAASSLRAGADPRAVLDGRAAAGGSLPPLPASTGFVVLDRTGGAVACSLTMDNLFGTGRIVPGTGILLAASPGIARPLLSAAIEWNANIHGFRAAVAGSGQEGAALATADALYSASHGTTAMPRPVPEPGRANAVACARYLPGPEGSCRWATDPRGSGLAAGSE